MSNARTLRTTPPLPASRLAPAATALALLMSCGGGGQGGFTIARDGGPGSDGGSAGAQDLAIADLTPLPDLTIIKDLVGLLPQPCGSSTCAIGQRCCFTGNVGACMDSCPDGTSGFACYGPQDCAGNPCCLSLKNFKPSDLACSRQMTSCVPGYDILGNDGQTRFCNVDADCTRGAKNTTFNRCCSGMFMGQPGKICIDPNLAGNAGLVCP